MDSLIGGQMVEDLNWREVVKDRDNALLLVKHWLVFLLAAKKQSVGAGDVVPRFWTASQVEIAAKFDFRLDFIWNQVMNLKTEIEMQVDRALAFESFFIWWIQNHSTRLRKENHEHLD